MKIKYNDKELPVDKTYVGKRVDGYIYGGNIFPYIPDKTVEVGAIDTEDGILAVCKKKTDKAMTIFMGGCLILLVSILAWKLFAFDTVNVKAKYNSKMEQVDGYSNISLVGNSKDVSVYIKGDGWVTEKVLLEKDKTIPKIYTGLSKSDTPVEVTVIYASGNASKEFPATIKVMSEGKAEKGEVEIPEESAPVEEIVIE